jgi:hypothetical protein
MPPQIGPEQAAGFRPCFMYVALLPVENRFLGIYLCEFLTGR